MQADLHAVRFSRIPPASVAQCVEASVFWLSVREFEPRGGQRVYLSLAAQTHNL